MFASVVDTPFFKDMIAESHKKLVESMFTERHYPKGQVLYFHGDEGNEMYIVKSGTLKIYRQNEEQEIIFGHQFPGEVIGELEVFHYDNRRTASVAALEETVLWMIKKPDLLELTKLYPDILRKTIFILSERLSQADRKVEYLAFLDIRVRVANLLIDLYINFGLSTSEGSKINWKFTQQHLASMIGSGRESTARTMKELQREGILDIRRRYIYILDIQALQNIAGRKADMDENSKWHNTHVYDSSSN
ncbi:transcriptional regulator [Xylanibacillus composti]|uniref:Transcriptional regulator n=1 Tax=Xylanibacillus composti TaxID=1572762 RepID=A0A8J4H305_9BACL|nr:Crp/Fnr family transcriptional regulator [Xylanibacillus composti]GIQ70018.1 transcriptional regulator [Xylanibacillus composti]